MYACSSGDDPAEPPPGTADASTPDDDDDTTPPDDGDGGAPGDDSGTGDEDGGVKDPIQGIGAPKLAADSTQFADGPQWKGDALYFSQPLANVHGILLKMSAAGVISVVREGNGTTTGAIGDSIDKAGAIISAERKQITRTLPDGGAEVIATTFATEGGTVNFDTPNDLVARPSDGTIFVTDPGYFAAPTENHLVKIAPNGAATLLETFPDTPRPNGIALSKDEKTLYVSFTQPKVGTKPFIRKYTVNADGTLKDPKTFAELADGSDPDGLGIDVQGNVYCALKTGVNVYKADGTRYGKDPSIPLGDVATGVAFGGADSKTLFITSGSGKIYKVGVNVPGVPR